MTRTWLAALLFACTPGILRADDWPTFKGDAARTGRNSGTLGGKLSLRWLLKSPDACAPAWPVSSRLAFDRANHPVVGGGMVFYGGSADCQVHALDATTGKERWTFFTGGPVRFAPALWKDRLFAASDDGYLYCLAAADGKLLWKRRGGPDDGMVLGNDRIVSRWPARGGPAVFEDTVYFAAGIWPSEGIYIYALEAATGKVLWCNDTSGSIFMGQPHGGANANSGVAVQGYLVVNGGQLLVPTGRAVPAAFDRASGKFLYFHLQENGHKGGSATVGLGADFYNAGYTYNAVSGKLSDPVAAGEVAALPDGILSSTSKGDLIAYQWADKSKTDRKGVVTKYKGLQKTWKIDEVPGGASVAVVGKFAVCGGDRQITIADLETKKVVWSAEVDGMAYGLAVADGRVFVTTDRGTLYCFDNASTAKPTIHERGLVDTPYPIDAAREKAAAEILKQSNVSAGYCIDLACGDGALAWEIARKTDLRVYAIDPDPERVAEARRKLTEAGLYGARVTVHQGDPNHTRYPRYVADLVVSGRALTEGMNDKLSAEAARVQRPFGGVALLGKAEALKKSVRGPLEGAGEWTHQYADPANTCCSSDILVQGKLGILWYRDSDLESPNRHGRGPAPLFHKGRLFVEGTNALRAVDAYNGRSLWEVPLPGVLKPYHGEHLVGTAATNSNLCVSEDGIFVRSGNLCLRLDPATGKKLGEFTAPTLVEGKLLPWGFIACVPAEKTRAGLLFGSLASPEHVVKYAYGKADMSHLLTESAAFFALDADTGKHRWTYKAKHSIRHNAIAIAGGRVYLIDRPLAEKDKATGDKTKEHPDGELIALDAATGKEIWRKTKDVYGTVLSVSPGHDVLLMSYQPTRFKLPSEVGGKLAGIRASSGDRLWDIDAKYVTRPIINDSTIYAQGGAWDLKTGEAQPFAMKRSYGCGQLSGSKHLLLFRSATLAYYDLLSPKGVIDYGGLRPGCWINAIPAGGLVLVPDATSGCQCSYLNQAWIALQPLE